MIKTSIKGVRKGFKDTVSQVRHGLENPQTGLGDLKILATRVLERAREISQSLKNQKSTATDAMSKKKI